MLLRDLPTADENGIIRAMPEELSEVNSNLKKENMLNWAWVGRK